MNGITPLPKGEYGDNGITPLPKGEYGGMMGPPPIGGDTQRLFQGMQPGRMSGIDGQAVQPGGMSLDGQAVQPGGGNMMGPPPMAGGGGNYSGIDAPMGGPLLNSGNPMASSPYSAPQGGGQGATGYGAFANGAGDIGTGRIDQLGQMATNNNPAMQGYNSFAAGGGDISAALQQQLAASGGNPSMAEQNLSNIARGGYLDRNDPIFEAVLKRSTDAAANAVNQQASAMGRTGSGTNQQVLASEIGALQNNARLGQYNQERQNQMGAIGMIDDRQNQAFNNQLGAANSASQLQGSNMDRRLNGISGQGGTFQGGIGQGLQAAGLSTGVQGQNVGNRMAGLGGQLNAATTGANFQAQNQDRQMNALMQQFGMGQTAMGNLGNAGSIYQSLLQGQNAPGQNMMGVGSYYEDLAGRQMNDQLRIGQDQQNAPLRNIQALLAAAGGGGQYGNTTQTAQGPRNGLSQGIGALLGGGSLLSQLFGG